MNYPNVALRDREVHFCGIASYNKWERVRGKPERMGRGPWGSRTRRLFYCWTPDIAKKPFGEWAEIAHCFHHAARLPRFSAAIRGTVADHTPAGIIPKPFLNSRGAAIP